VDDRISLRKLHSVDLKHALSLAFPSAGFWSIARNGLMIETVLGWLFLRFAYDSLVQLRPRSPQVGYRAPKSITVPQIAVVRHKSRGTRSLNRPPGTPCILIIFRLR
jgi:hypothetical protein